MLLLPLARHGGLEDIPLLQTNELHWHRDIALLSAEQTTPTNDNGDCQLDERQLLIFPS
jgi:hypothetical protein